jgi:hypothetical protein
MEKKVDLLLKFAEISDIIEKIDYNLKSPTLIFEVSKVEFEKIYDLIVSKYGKYDQTKPENTFTIKIGTTEIVFNTNSDG